MSTEKRKDRCRNICGIIYPDDSKYNEYLLVINQYTHYCILHDHSVDEDGNEKKVHMHFLLRFDNPVSLTGLAKRMNILENYLQRCTDARTYVRYLMHLDDPDKEQYKKDDVITNDSFFVERCIAPTDEIDFLKIFMYFLNHYKDTHESRYISFKVVLMWVLANGYYDNYKKSYRIIADVIRQENGDLN